MGDRSQRILDITQCPEPLVHVFHDAMKVDASLRFERERLEEKVHQKSLAPAYAAPEVQAGNPGNRIPVARQELREPPFWRRRRQQALLQIGEQLDDARLRRITHVTVLQQVLLVSVANIQ